MKGLFYLLSLTFFSAGGFCQEAKVLKETGIKKMSVFLGTWKAGNTATSNNSTTSTTSCGWSLNGRYLVCDQMIHQPEGLTNNLSIYSYDSLSDSYLLILVGIPHTDPFSIPVTARGDTLFYTGSYMDHDKKVFTRTLNIFKSFSSYIFISQSSPDGFSWVTTLEGSASKTAP
jgi:hypothetical protein